MRKVSITDFYVMKGMLFPTAALCLVIGIVMAFWMKTPAIAGVPLAMFIPYTVVMNQWAIDEKSGWGSFRLAMAETRNNLVNARYGEMVLYLVMAGVLGWLICVGVDWVMRAAGFPIDAFGSPGLNVSPLMVYLVISVSSALLIGLAIAVSMPLLAAFGGLKGIMLIPVFTMMASGMLLKGIFTVGKSIHFGDFAKSAFPLLAATQDGMLVLIMLIGSIFISLCLVVSWLVARRLYKVREF
ncbi:MAG: ABC-2 transporter permease [Arcanobacterium sp.]|nr:ABC-2 transporter permease [Arcanobacterium sp.]MDY5588573.1 ABC-2 transporter permease [Arcanobacterium sp.]